MSTNQVSFDAIQPTWLRGYDDPVIRVPGSSTKRFHKPDRMASEPQPACGGKNELNWSVKERTIIETFWSPCQRCYGGNE